MTRPTNLSDFDGYNFHIVPVSCAKCGADGLLDWVFDVELANAPSMWFVYPKLRSPWCFVADEIRCGDCNEQTK